MKGGWDTVGPAHAARMVSDSGELAILKMDCEGCEVLLFNHTMQADPGFFDRVDQFAIEVHISQRWMPNERAVLAYGRLLALLLRSDFLLFHATTSWCTYGEERGLVSQLVSWGYFQRESDHCEVLLFAKARHDDPRLRWRPPFPVVGVHAPKLIQGEENIKKWGVHYLLSLEGARRPSPAVKSAIGPDAVPASMAPPFSEDRMTPLGGGWYEIALPSAKHMARGPKGEDYTKFYALQHGLAGTAGWQVVWNRPTEAQIQVASYNLCTRQHGSSMPCGPPPSSTRGQKGVGQSLREMASSGVASNAFRRAGFHISARSRGGRKD